MTKYVVAEASAMGADAWIGHQIEGHAQPEKRAAVLIPRRVADPVVPYTVDGAHVNAIVRLLLSDASRIL